MIIFLLFLIQTSFILPKEIAYRIMIDKFFKQSVNDKLDFYNCKQKESEKNLHYRGRPKKMSEIIKNEKLDINLLNKSNIKIKKYKAVFINYQSELDYIYFFPNSTIFFVNSNNNPSGGNEKVFDSNYCFFLDYNYAFDKIKNYYIIINKEINEVYISLIIVSLVIFFIFGLFFIISFAGSSCCLKFSLPIYVFNFANLSIVYSYIVLFTCALFLVCYFSSIIYSVFKSYILFHIIILLNGYSIIHNDYTFKQKFKFGFYIFLFEEISTLIFTYIMFFIPSLDNFYLFFTRNILEYFLLLLYMVKMIKLNGYRLYRQYKLERRLRTLLTITYKIKFIIYLKILIFTFLYCLTFIVFHIILIASKINYYIDGFLYYHLIIIGIESFFTIILSIIFFPSKISIMYYFPVKYDYDSLKFIGEIKQDKKSDMNFSKLTKKICNKYKQKDYPIALISPFTKTDNPFKDFHFGLVPK